MKRISIINNVLALVLVNRFCVVCPADTAMPAETAGTSQKQEAQVDPNDLEVIRNMAFLQDWDIVGPQGPDFTNSSVSKDQNLRGADNAE